MTRPNTDTICAIFLLIVCAVFFGASFHIKDMGFESLGSDVWPRFILALLFVFSTMFLFQSLKKPPEEKTESKGFKAWIAKYQNAFKIYILFISFLLTLDILGMLIGGTAFVFLTLTALGERTRRSLGIHAVIAVISITFMWSVFTFGLKVFLPQGIIFSAW